MKKHLFQNVIITVSFGLFFQPIILVYHRLYASQQAKFSLRITGRTPTGIESVEKKQSLVRHGFQNKEIIIIN
jgi:hypothetical protein